MENQLEHAPLLDGQGAYGNNICNNTITIAGDTAMEISGSTDHEPKNNNFNENTVYKCGNHGIFA